MTTKIVTIPVTPAATTRLYTDLQHVSFRSHAPVAAIVDWCARHGLRIRWDPQRRSLVIEFDFRPSAN